MISFQLPVCALFRHSLHIASTIYNLAAFLAGINPDTIPSIVEKIKAKIIRSGVTTATEVLMPTILPMPMRLNATHLVDFFYTLEFDYGITHIIVL